MITKEYLSEVQRLQNIVELKQKQIVKLRESISVSAVCVDFGKVQSSGYSDKTGDIACKIIDLETELRNDILNLICCKHEIINQIQKLQNILHVQLLFKRYIEFKDFRKIGKEMDLSYRYSLKLHSDALKAFDMMYQETLQKVG